MCRVKGAASSPLKRASFKYSCHGQKENVLKVAVCSTLNSLDLNILSILSVPFLPTLSRAGCRAPLCLRLSCSSSGKNLFQHELC